MPKLCYLSKLYLGHGVITKDVESLKKQIRDGERSIYLVIISPNSKDLLDIISSGRLGFQGYAGRTLQVVGLAKDTEDAAELVRGMTEDCVAARGDCDLRAYLAELEYELA